MPKPGASEPGHFARAFGLTWQSDFPLEYFTAVPALRGPADVTVQHVERLSAREVLRPINRGAVCSDGFRFRWKDQAAIDVYGTGRVEVQPLPGWTGALPLSFYSTIAALLLAERGLLPFHACGIEVAGRAVMLCGPSGAGKSTLAAGLVQHGARFIADDLCAVDCAEAEPLMLPGRPAVRLFDTVAALIGAADVVPVQGDPRGKVTAALAASQAEAARRLGLIVLLRDEPPPEPLALRFAELRRQLFRPRWLSGLPGHAERQRKLRTLATQIPLIAIPPLGMIEAETFGQRCAAALQTISAALTATHDCLPDRQ